MKMYAINKESGNFSRMRIYMRNICKIETLLKKKKPSKLKM